jgi:hypothetical protein
MACVAGERHWSVRALRLRRRARSPGRHSAQATATIITVRSGHHAKEAPLGARATGCLAGRTASRAFAIPLTAIKIVRTRSVF